MHPRNVPVLTAAGLDCCTLANNHVRDWSQAGLQETLDTLLNAGVPHAGAGRDLDAASAPAKFKLPGGGTLRIYSAGANIVHGHSSHHARGIEVYKGRPIMYGVGDLVNDYEGIVKQHDA